jgi:hypothetical protein
LVLIVDDSAWREHQPSGGGHGSMDLVAATKAYDFYLREKHVERILNPEDVRLAKEMFIAAIEDDPNYPRPYPGLAWIELRKLKWNRSVDIDTALPLHLHGRASPAAQSLRSWGALGAWPHPFMERGC